MAAFVRGGKVGDEFGKFLKIIKVLPMEKIEKS
jgi:hypothetical protein